MGGEDGDEAGIPCISDGGGAGGAGSGTHRRDEGGFVQGGVGHLLHMQGE